MADSESQEKQVTTQADAAEVHGAAVAEESTVLAAEDTGQAEQTDTKSKAVKKKPAKKKPAKKKRGKVGDWSGVDQILAFVLLANLALMAVLVLAGPGEKTPESTGASQEPASKEDVFVLPPEALVEEGGAKPSDNDLGRAAVEPQDELWSQALRQASLGNLSRAIELLHQLERSPDLQGVVRSTVYQQLAYYYGMDGNREKAAQYQALTTRGHLVGLNPKQLWDLATEAHRLRDLRGARTFYARFLLQQGRMDEETEKLVPLAYLRLANSYRAEADPIQQRKAKEDR
ncbi:MAG: hypothetical protein CSA62_02370 [Planctomycetota bacterium]|nr:MAG: hypothetical protein CSA62_02370 [Planctomycetota bacterium]